MAHELVDEFGSQPIELHHPHAFVCGKLEEEKAEVSVS